MKQTQTKLFDFSDVGLDFCAGSKNLFPDRFKKMLSFGYNVRTVSTVAVSGNQVTLTYGVSHGYVSDRVLKVDSGVLAAINDGEFWIDSVTTNTVTMTIDGAPNSITGGFTTKIASLGWELVYEQSNIQVYKFKTLNESSLFFRICFQDVLNRRNAVSPCVGESYDLATGVMTDTYAFEGNKAIMSPGDGFKWEFSAQASSSYNSFNYASGYDTFGRASVVGSAYHLAFLTCTGKNTTALRINGIFPTAVHSYQNLKLPVMFGETYEGISGEGDFYQANWAAAYIGNIRCVFSGDGNVQGFGSNKLFPTPASDKTSFLSANIDPFNVTTLEPIRIFEHSSAQHLGYMYGAYMCRYSKANRPIFSRTASPSFEYDSDETSIVATHGMGWDSDNTSMYVGFPVEEIKIG